MIVSAARLAANRANALRSTGPKTPEGKLRSSQNAWRHGLTARIRTVSARDLPYYNKLQADFIAEFQPANLLETQTVRRLAAFQWGLNAISAATFALDVLEPGVCQALKVLANFSVYEQRLSRSFFETFKWLKILQTRGRIGQGGFVYAFSPFEAPILCPSVPSA